MMSTSHTIKLHRFVLVPGSNRKTITGTCKVCGLPYGLGYHQAQVGP